MITKTNIQKGIEAGAVSFTTDPNMENGRVCKIGQGWFYFGGPSAESETPDNYLEHTPMDDVLSEVINALDSLKESDPDEYCYYESVLEEAGFMAEDVHEKECFIVVHMNYMEGIDAYAFFKMEEAEKSISDDADTTMKDLSEQGYAPVRTKDAAGGAGIHVPDSGIYFEWSIVESTIR